MSYVTKVHGSSGIDGGDEVVVASGGTLTVESGGTVALEAGAIKTEAAGVVKTITTTASAVSFAVTAADSGNVYRITAADKVASLPATVAGLTYTFIVDTIGGSTGFSISPVTADSISGGTVNKDLINTEGTSVVGDTVTVLGDGADGWYVIARTGTWAEEG